MFCKCGCGRKTETAVRTDKRCGTVAGLPRNYVTGHSRKGVIQSDEERIAKYSVSHPNGCIVWNGARCRDGYALYTPHNSPMRRLSRFLWEREYGTLKPTELVCHTCDNPSCINTAHFFKGSTQANMNDMKEKRRQSHGIKHAKTHLTEEEARHIKNTRGNYTLLQRSLGVCAGTISNIRTGKTWKHLD